MAKNVTIISMFQYLAGISWGTLVGFGIAIPIGPVGIICVQRTLAKNRTSGLVSGLGAAFADALLASVGAFSITVIFSFIDKNQSLFEIVGGSLLLFLGIAAIIKKPKHNDAAKDTAIGYFEEFISAFALTITNPLSAFMFFFAFGIISEKIGQGLPVAISFVIGVFIGSCLWWLFLTYVTDKIAHKITPERISSVNKWFARIIVVLGIVILLGVLFKQF